MPANILHFIYNWEGLIRLRSVLIRRPRSECWWSRSRKCKWGSWFGHPKTARHFVTLAFAPSSGPTWGVVIRPQALAGHKHCRTSWRKALGFRHSPRRWVGIGRFQAAGRDWSLWRSTILCSYWQARVRNVANWHFRHWCSTRPTCHFQSCLWSTARACSPIPL